jgi:hypothetical protein
MNKLTPEQKEAQELVKGIDKSTNKLPDEDKNILDWSTKELSAYVNLNIKGLSANKKIKFAMDLDKRIKEEKKKRDKK